LKSLSVSQASILSDYAGDLGLRELSNISEPALQKFIDAGTMIDPPSLLQKLSEAKEAKGAKGFKTGGIVYASNGALVNYKPRGTDTVPAMLTPGEFVVNRAATQQHLPLLKSINSGGGISSAPSIGSTAYAKSGGLMNHAGVRATYAKSGGIINPIYRAEGGTGSSNMMGAVQSIAKSVGFDMSSASSVFNNFIKSFNTETNNFGSLINNLAKVFPALNGPVGAFGGHVDKLVRALNELKSIEIKGPHIPDTINVNSETIRVELVGPENTNYKLSPDDQKKISDSVALQLKTLITMGRIA
jgi:hypothetical protein